MQVIGAPLEPPFPPCLASSLCTTCAFLRDQHSIPIHIPIYLLVVFVGFTVASGFVLLYRATSASVLYCTKPWTRTLSISYEDVSNYFYLPKETRLQDISVTKWKLKSWTSCVSLSILYFEFILLLSDIFSGYVSLRSCKIYNTTDSAIIGYFRSFFLF